MQGVGWARVKWVWAWARARWVLAWESCGIHPRLHLCIPFGLFTFMDTDSKLDPDSNPIFVVGSWDRN